LWGRQELYCLRHTSSFFVGSCFLLRSVCTMILLFHASCSYWHGRHIPPCPSFLHWDAITSFFPWAGLQLLSSSQSSMQHGMTVAHHCSQLLVEMGSC
jgi:hypothetical protein